jgi:hypothetical protein
MDRLVAARGLGGEDGGVREKQHGTHTRERERGNRRAVFTPANWAEHEYLLHGIEQRGRKTSE